MKVAARWSARALAFAWVIAGASASAQDFEALLRSQHFKIIVGSAPGGSYDTYARLMARHMGRHLPGRPNVIVQNMPGGGGYAAANHIYTMAQKDGSTIATFSRSVPMQPLIDPTGVQFDPKKMEWIGSPSDETGITLSSAASGVRNLTDLRQKGLTVASTGPGTDSNVYARVVGKALGVRVSLVVGYTGSQDMLLAVERGEAGGIGGVSWTSVWPGKKTAIESGTLIPLAQIGRASKHEKLKDVPVLTDLVTDPNDLRALEIIVSRQIIAFPFAAPPGLPPDRLAVVRAAFDATLRDPAFLAEAATSGLSVNPVGSAEMTDLIHRIYTSPPELVAQVKKMMGME